MELLDKYQIHLNELVEGVNCFNYIIDKKFFEHFEITEVNDVDIVAEINIEKRFNIIILRFKISGNINVSCDRCLENFKLNIDHENEVFVKLSDGSSEEQSENMILIPKTESILDITQHLHEFISLNLPHQKVHPEDKEGNSTCNKKMLEKIEEYSIGNNENINVSIWNELNKLKNGTPKKKNF